MEQKRVEWLENITATWLKVKVPLVLGLFVLQPTSCTRNEGLDPKGEVLLSAYIAILEVRKQPIVGTDSTRAIDSVLAKHGFSSESFASAVKERSAKPEEWVKFYQEVTRRLEEADKRRTDSTTAKPSDRTGSS